MSTRGTSIGHIRQANIDALFDMLDGKKTTTEVMAAAAVLSAISKSLTAEINVMRLGNAVSAPKSMGELTVGRPLTQLPKADVVAPAKISARK